MSILETGRLRRAVLWGALLLPASAATLSAAPWVAGYYAGWEYQHLPIASVDMTSMDALIHFAVVPSANGSLDNGVANEMNVNMASVVTTVHAAGKKVLFTVGGAGAYAGFQGAMSSANQATFINNIANFMTANNYDGVDIDMEPMAAVDVVPYVAFVKALRAKMNAVKPGSLLTAAVVWEPAAFAQLTGVFDHIDLMTYSLTGGTWYNETWHDAPVFSAPAIGGGSLASVDSMVKQFTAAGIPAADLGIGVTFDPYIWTGGSGVTKPQQTWTSAPTVSETYYYSIAKTYGLVEGASTSNAGSVYGWDSSAQASYLSVTGSPASADAFISYDDVTAINAKFAYAKSNAIGSVIIWDLAAGFRTDLPAGKQDLLLQAAKGAAYGGAAAPPIISAVSASGIGQSAATIGWTTNEAANSQVAYGLTSAYGMTTTLGAALTTTHSAALSGLASGTLYHYSVLSIDASGNLAASPDATFTTVAGVLSSSLSDNFSSYAPNACIADGASFGPWTSAFSGYGCDQVETSGGLFWLDQAPAASTAAALTHSSLSIGPSFAAPITFSATVYTKAQLRQNNPPNPWEVGWVVWDYTDNSHFYAFIPQPNGWELNKEDPAYPGSQRFLATGSSPLFPVGVSYTVKIVQTANVITVYVNGQLITTFTDTQTPYTAGNIGLYNEDSDVHFENIAVNVTPPVLSGIGTYNISQTSATVTWDTNEITDSQVEYGLTAAYGINTTLNHVLTTGHTAVFSNLNAGTLYHYAVMSHDIAGDLTTSADFTFTTVSTITPIISGLSASGITQTAATISWISNESVESQVEYGPTAAYTSTTPLNTVLTASPSDALSGLSAGTVYHYAAISIDAFGNRAASADSTFATLATGTTSTVMTTPFINNFSSYTVNKCFADEAIFGPWTSAFGGYGCTEIQASGSRFWLSESPAVSTAAALTHAALVLGPAFAAPMTFSLDLNTVAQLRQNSPPNPWEVGYVIWDYSDINHFYYFQAKPNGWELGKEDPTYPGLQRPMATGTSPSFAIADWHIVKVIQVQNAITVYVNGQLITSVTDTQNPYMSGNIGLYAADSQVRFKNVAVNAPPSSAPSVTVVLPAAPATPAANASISGTITIMALTSNDADVALVQFLLDGAPLGTALDTPPFTLVWNTQAFGPGAHVLSAIIWDAEGNSSIAAAVPVMINAAGIAASAVDPRAPQKFLSPAQADGINDVATFGTTAAEVSIYNVRGRLVFHGTQQGSAPIVWDCKDGSGRVRESGIYIAKIRASDSSVIYQSFAIAK